VQPGTELGNRIPAGSRHLGSASREAQREAVADAERRVHGYVAAPGRSLGPLARIIDGSTGPRPVRFAAMAARSSVEPDIR